MITNQDFRVTNLQSTVSILSENYKLSLKDVASTLIGMSKLNQRFAAIVMRAFFGLSKTVCMVFGHGKLIVVGSKSPRHAIYVSHMYRLYIASVKARFFDPRRGDYVMMPFDGRTRFTDFQINNICATTNAGYKIDLAKMVNVNSHLFDYQPNGFPGAIMTVPAKTGNAIKATVFDNGNINIAGCPTIDTVIESFAITQSYTVNFQTNIAALPKDKIHRYRIEQREKGIRERAGLKPTVQKNISTTYDILHLLPPRVVYQTSGPPLVRAFLTMNVRLIEHLLKVHKAPRLRAIKYLDENKDTLTPFLNRTLEWLNKHFN